MDKISHPYLRWVIEKCDLYKYPGLDKAIKNVIRNGSTYPRLAVDTTVTRPRPATGTEKGPSKIGPVDIKIAGTSYHQDAVKASRTGDKVELLLDSGNPDDPFAVKIINQVLVNKRIEGWLGFAPQKYSELLCAAIKKGHCFDCKISRISGSSRIGVTISLEVDSRGGAASVGPAIAVTGP